jgi:hypothetical protein
MAAEERVRALEELFAEFPCCKEIIDSMLIDHARIRERAAGLFLKAIPSDVYERLSEIRELKAANPKKARKLERKLENRTGCPFSEAVPTKKEDPPLIISSTLPIDYLVALRELMVSQRLPTREELTNIAVQGSKTHPNVCTFFWQFATSAPPSFFVLLVVLQWVVLSSDFNEMPPEVDVILFAAFHSSLTLVRWSVCFPIISQCSW